MKRFSVSEAKNGLSALLAAVRAGEVVLILDRGVPVAQLGPVPAGSAATSGEAIEGLVRAGLATRGVAAPPLALLKSPPPTPRGGSGAVSALLAERESGW